jgi:hypothetical protein
MLRSVTSKLAWVGRTLRMTLICALVSVLVTPLDTNLRRVAAARLASIGHSAHSVDHKPTLEQRRARATC